jgi:hypothetical protein
MNEKERLLHETKEERNARIEKMKEDFKERKSGRPMGYIYPKRIRQAMAGENPTLTIYMNTDGVNHETHSVGDTWTDANGKIHIQHDGWVETKGTNSDIFESVRVPMFCPECKGPMNAKIDEKFYWLRNKCHKCVASDETKMKLDGTYKKYEDLIVLRNKLAFFGDAKIELEEYYNSLKPKQEYVNHDGSIEYWTDPDFEKTKSFILNEIKEVDEVLKKLIDEFNELEKEYESSQNNR